MTLTPTTDDLCEALSGDAVVEASLGLAEIVGGLIGLVAIVGFITQGLAGFPTLDVVDARVVAPLSATTGDPIVEVALLPDVAPQAIACESPNCAALAVNTCARFVCNPSGQADAARRCALVRLQPCLP